MQGFHMPHRQSSLKEGRTFHYKVPFQLNFISLKKILQRSNLGQECWMFFMLVVSINKLWKTNKLILHILKKIKTEAVAQKCVFCKKGVLRNFAKFTGKYLYQRLFLDKVAGLRPATLLKKDSGTGVFLWILQNLQEHLFLQNTSGGCFCKNNTTKLAAIT